MAKIRACIISAAPNGETAVIEPWQESLIKSIFKVKLSNVDFLMSQYRNPSIVFVAAILLAAFLTPIPISEAASTSTTFSPQYTLFNQKLYVSIQPSLYTYYSNQTDTLSFDSNYSQFITPQAVQPIADSILRITENMPNSNEEFANAVLTLVHQIPYKITGAKYPIETLADNSGDCGAVSLLAASILKAGGLDVILIKYTGINPGHLNVGINLGHTPLYHNLFIRPTSFEYDNKTYWTAEATPQADWKVGDQSSMLASTNPVFISIDKCEETSPGQVSSSLGSPLPSSSIAVNLSAQPSDANGGKRALVISGAIQPATPISNISIYINENGTRLNVFKAVTDMNGTYAFVWNLTFGGTYYITASWSGNTTNAGADSSPITVFVGPESLREFQSETYSYIIGKAVADVAVKPFMGIEDFLSIPLGENVSLSYSFIVLPTGSVESEIPTRKVTVPASEYTIRTANRQTHVFEVPAQTVVVPANIPQGLEPLLLPDDFNHTINDKFCFIIEENMDSNYSLNVKGLNDYNVSDIKGQQDSACFLNATQSIEENTWYKVTMTILGGEVTTNLQGENGAPIESLSSSKASEFNQKLVLLIGNDADSAVLFRDLKIEVMNKALQPPKNTDQMPESLDFPLPYVYGMMFLAVLISASASVYAFKKRQKRLKD